MPNHCHNDLYISGETKTVEAILAHIKGEESDLDFNKIIPYPEHFAKLDREMEDLGWEKYKEKYGHTKGGYNVGGYEWCRDNWDTKWNAYEVVRRDYGGVCITFQTAWCPPIKVIEVLHELFPNSRLTLEYFECGAAVCGGVSFISEEEFNEYYEGDDIKWTPRTRHVEWSGEYRGHRGG